MVQGVERKQGCRQQAVRKKDNGGVCCWLFVGGGAELGLGAVVYLTHL